MKRIATTAALLRSGSKQLQRYCSKTPSLIEGEGFRWDVKSSPHKLMGELLHFRRPVL